MFNQSGQRVTNQTNIGHDTAEVNKMLRYALKKAAERVPDEVKDSILASITDIIRDTWKYIDD